MRPSNAVLIPCLLLSIGSAFAQSVEKEPIAVLELGGAGEWSSNGGGLSLGPEVAVEVTPIENRLELEAGVTPYFSRHSTEWETDLLFKKPWTVSDKLEFMLGAGPDWIHVREKGMTRNSMALEVAPDFMFWSSARHRLGWYLEPGYDYDFARGHEQSAGVTFGLLIGIP